MNTSSNKLIQKLISLSFVILCAYILSTILFVYLPKTGVDFIEDANTNLEYKKYDGFYKNVKTNEPIVQKRVEKVETQTLSSFILKGIYSTSSNAGWVILENKIKNKSHILSQYDEVEGYILTKLYKNYVLFEKEAKEYRLDIKSSENNVKYEISKKVDGIKEEIKVDGNDIKIKRDYLNSYVKDIDKVWNNISINEIRKDGKIEGFKVGSVNKNSVFGKLGLIQGDIIKSINNKVISSYADAFKIYNNINNTKYLNIEIIRNNETMELNYEID